MTPHNFPDSKVHGANMGTTWALLAPGGPHVGPKNLAIRVSLQEAHQTSLNVPIIDSQRQNFEIFPRASCLIGFNCNNVTIGSTVCNNVASSSMPYVHCFTNLPQCYDTVILHFVSYHLVFIYHLILRWHHTWITHIMTFCQRIFVFSVTSQNKCYDWISMGCNHLSLPSVIPVSGTQVPIWVFNRLKELRCIKWRLECSLFEDTFRHFGILIFPTPQRVFSFTLAELFEVGFLPIDLPAVRDHTHKLIAIFGYGYGGGNISAALATETQSGVFLLIGPWEIR